MIAPLPHAQAMVLPHLSTVVLTGVGVSVDAGLPVTDGLMPTGVGPVATAARRGLPRHARSLESCRTSPR